jgi:hypothetical protein
VDILKPDVYLEHLIHVNASIPQNLTVFSKFNSSHGSFCPITSINITKIVDEKSPEKELEAAYEYMKMGQNYLDEDEFDFWHNLVLTETSFATTYLVYIEAATGTP